MVVHSNVSELNSYYYVTHAYDYAEICLEGVSNYQYYVNDNYKSTVMSLIGIYHHWASVKLEQ